MWTNSSQKWSIHRYIFKLLPLRSQEELCVLLGTIRNVNINLVTSNSEKVLFSSGCSWCEVDSLFPYLNYFTDLFYFTLNYFYPSTLIKIYDCEHLLTIISTSNIHYKTNHGDKDVEFTQVSQIFIDKFLVNMLWKFLVKFLRSRFDPEGVKLRKSS